MSPFIQINRVRKRNAVMIRNCQNKYFICGPYNNVLVGTDAINIIGIKENSTFLSNPVYMESGRVENFNIS